ncbi:MAG: glycosyltransferase, partial [Deltaproteobacteria bacterium]
AEVSSIGSRIYGVTDTIEDGVTGFLFSAGDPGDLALKMSTFIENPALIKKMGKAAKARAEALYSKEKVTSAMLDFYKKAAHAATSA